MSTGISLVDAETCYDPISHAIATLVFRLFGVSKKATGAMLKTIQEMKFFLWKPYGDLNECADSLVDVKTQTVPRQWCCASWVGSGDHHHTESAQTERAWCKIPLSHLPYKQQSCGGAVCG
jgi:hypothetical protein